MRRRVDLQAAWGIDHLPDTAGLDAEQMLAAAAAGSLKALVTAAVDLADMADPEAAYAALASDDVFVVSLEQRRSAVTEVADVVFPVALLEEQLGTFINWEHRLRPVNIINTDAPSVMTDVRVLAALADALGSDLGMRTPPQAQAAYYEITDWEGAKPGFTAAAGAPAQAGGEGLKLASWHQAIDDSRCLDGAETLRLTAPAPLARISPATAAALGVRDGEPVMIGTDSGEVVLPAAVTASMVDDVVWAPTNSGVELFRTLHARPGDRVRLVVENTAGGVA